MWRGRRGRTPFNLITSRSTLRMRKLSSTANRSATTSTRCGSTLECAHNFSEIDPSDVEAKLMAAGFAKVEGSKGSIAARPVTMVRATR